jgi:hypothetical protein
MSDPDFWQKRRGSMIAWWTEQRRIAAEWSAQRLAAVAIGQKRQPKPRPRPAIRRRRQRSRQVAMQPPVIAPSRAAISSLLGYSTFVAAALITAFREAVQAFREPLEPQLRDYDDLIKSLNARRRAAGLPPAAENKWRDPADEYLKPRWRRPQEPSPDPVPVDGEGVHELLPRDSDDNDGPRGGPRL